MRVKIEPKCPFCHQSMEKKLELIPLSDKQKKVFDLVFSKGRNGVGFEEVKKRIFPNCVDTSVRTVICSLNKKIWPAQLKIKSGLIYIDGND